LLRKGAIQLSLETLVIIGIALAIAVLLFLLVRYGFAGPARALGDLLRALQINWTRLLPG
jgi:hypothetical protein